MTTTTRAVNVDTWVAEARPSDAHGADAELAVAYGTGTRRYVYAFAARPWADSRGVTVISAYLDFYLSRANGASAIPLELRRVTSSWSEKSATWSNRPAVDATVASSVTVGASAAIGTLVRFDVTSLLQAIANGSPYYGVEVRVGGSTALGPLRVASSENANVARRPVLTVNWSSPPDAPADLRPASGRFVSIRKPVLSWSFGDVRDASAYQTAYRAEVDDAADFATPEYDSGQVSSGSSQIDLAATAYAGLPTDGSLRYWRAAVWDDGGSLSAWSDPVTLRYAPVGTVTISTPAATTSDVRPAVTWSFTPPATPAGFSAPVQAAWRVLLERLVAGRYSTLADSGLVTGTATSWSSPVPLPDLAGTYRVTVYVADSLDRESLPNASSLASASRVFTWTPTGGVTDPSGLTAPVVNDYAVALAWTRATRPDHWALEVDGQYLEDAIDVTPTGTSYAWTYYGVLPRKSSTLKLHAVEVIGAAYVLSPGVTTTVTTSPRGIWLVDPSSGTQIHLGDVEELDAAIAENSAVYPRLGDRAPVLVTELVRGYEGKVAGALLAWDGQDPRAAKASAIALRQAAGTLRLVLGDLNLPVAIFNLEANPTPIVGDSRFDVAFEFVQVGEFDRT